MITPKTSRIKSGTGVKIREDTNET